MISPNCHLRVQRHQPEESVLVFIEHAFQHPAGGRSGGKDKVQVSFSSTPATGTLASVPPDGKEQGCH